MIDRRCLGSGLPKVAVVILNWNSPDDTLACLCTVAALCYPAVHMIVVDNASNDDSVARIRAAYPQVELLETGENRGYAGGNNLGVSHAIEAGADYVWLLNDDTQVAPDSLSALIDTAARHPGAGFLGPVVYIQEEPQRVLSAGGLLETNGLGSHRCMGNPDAGQSGDALPVDYVSGCALLVSREAIERIGMLDEDFFAYQEDIEWCYRGGQAEFETLLVTKARVWHPDTRLRDKDSALVTYYTVRNHLLFLRRHSFSNVTMLRELGKYALWLANWSINPKWRSIRRKRNALWWAIMDFLHGRVGRAGRSL